MANNYPRVFKDAIPDELVLECLRPLGMKTLADQKWVSRSIITEHLLNQLHEVILLLEPYYHKHQAFYVLRPLTPNRYLQIIRHLCKAKGWELKTRETGRKKELSYCIVTTVQPSFTFTEKDWA